jgi:hypothetical protein
MFSKQHDLARLGRIAVFDLTVAGQISEHANSALKESDQRDALTWVKPGVK